MTISFDIGDDLEAIVEAVHGFAEENLRPGLRAFEEAGRLTDDLQRELHEMGLSTLVLPESLGGDDALDTRAAVLISEELAWGDLGAAVAISGPRSAGYLVLALGDDAQAKRLLTPFSDEAQGWGRVGSLALVEGPFGLDPAAIETTATLEGDSYVLRGAKRYVQSAGEAALTVVLARDPKSTAADPWDRLALFAVEGCPDGFEASERNRLLGLEACRWANVTLDGVKVPRNNRLGGESLAPGVLQAALRKGVARKKTIDAARLVGCARAGCEYAAKYAQERKTFGVYLYEHQALAFMMADMAMRVDAMRTLVWSAAAALDTGKDAYALAVRALRYAAEKSVEVATDAVQMLGGHGYVQDHPVEKWMRDVRTLGVVDGLVFDDEELALTGAGG